MKAPTAHLLNSIVLIVMGLWGYLGSSSPSPTALIPVIAGVILLLLYNGVRNENKVVAHVAVVLTLLLIIALFMPLKGALGRADTLGAARVGLMMLTGVLAMIAFIKSFRDARIARGSGE